MGFSITRPFNKVHELARAVQENKHLYTDDEFLKLSKERLILHEKYLLNLRNEAKAVFLLIVGI